MNNAFVIRTKDRKEPEVVSVILCGGHGSRLWPISTQVHPKQFLNVRGEPLLAHALRRAGKISRRVILVTNEKFLPQTEHIVASRRDSLDVTFLVEPVSKNTGPAVSLVIRHLLDIGDEGSICVFMPADQLIDNEANFALDVKRAILAATRSLTIFGMPPSKPEPNYGYIKAQKDALGEYSATSFVEKPEFNLANQMFNEQDWYWNLGLVCASVRDMAVRFEAHARDIWRISESVFSAASLNGRYTKFEERSFSLFPSISIDNAILEKSTSINMILASFDWVDIGSWPAISACFAGDASGNTKSESVEAYFFDSSNVHVQGQPDGKSTRAVYVLGLENVIVADTPEALLVASRDSASRIGSSQEVAAAIPERSTSAGSTVFRPWGRFTVIEKVDEFQIKLLFINPGQSLSEQVHAKRSEYWTILSGEALIEVEQNVSKMTAGEQIRIVMEKKHRATNIGSDILIILEAQLGDSFDEEDIVRTKDLYGRR